MPDFDLLSGLNKEVTQQEVLDAINTYGSNSDIRVNGIPVAPANPIPVTGNVSVSGAELIVINAIETLGFDLQSGAYENTTTIGGSYLLNRLELNFSSNESRDIEITSSQGTKLYESTNNTNLNITIDGEDDAFEDGNQITISVSQTSGACLVDVICVITKGALPLSGDPSIGGYTPSYYDATITGTGTVIGPVELGSRGFISLHVRSTFLVDVFTLVVEGTNEPLGQTGWSSLKVETVSGLSTSSVKNAGVYFIPTVTRWLRVRCSSYTSGTPVVNMMVSPQARASFARNVEDKDGIASWAFTPFGTGKVAQALWQAGSSFDGTELNKQEWNDDHSNGGTSTVGNGEVRLRTNSANAIARIETRKKVEFLGDNENEAFFVIRLGDTGTADNIKRWGMFDANNGFFIEQYHDGTSGKLRAITRKSGIDTVDTLFPLGISSPTNTVGYNFWRFIYTPSFILVYQGSNLVHFFISGTTSPLSPMFAEFTLPARIENINLNGSTADTSIYLQSCSVSRLAAEDSRKVIVSKIIKRKTPLAAFEVWESDWEDCQQYPHLGLVIFGLPRLAKGTLKFFFTEDPDNANAIIGPVPFSIDDLNLTLPFPLVNYGPYFKLIYENGSTPHTEFRLHAILYRDFPGDITRFPLQVIGPNEPVKVNRSLVEPSLIGERGLLGADREVFGAAITGSRISRISLFPTKPLANNELSTTGTTGGGTVTQEPTYAEFRLTSSTATTSVARMTTTISSDYKPGREMYAMFPTRFTTGIANTHQRAGLFTDNNGFFLGYNETNFGFTVRKSGIDSFVPLTQANGDPLDGTGFSRYSRGSILEALDPTKKNIWRIRVGLLGSSLQFFDIQSPDGLWMRVHSNRFPNLQQDASVLEWNLPFRAEIIKTSAAATNLVMGIGSVDVGWVGNPAGLEPSGIDSRRHVQIPIMGITTSGIQYTPPTGRRLIIKSISASLQNTDNSNAARVRLRDSSTGGMLFSIGSNQRSGSAATTAEKVSTYPEGLQVDTNLYLEIVSGTISIDSTIVGYTEAM